MMCARDEAIETVMDLSLAHPEYAPILRKMLDDRDCIFSRHNMKGHVTASACLLSQDLSQVLMIDARKFDRKLLPGGHVDPGEVPVEAARRELAEECGIDVDFIELLAPQPVSMNVHWIAESRVRNEERHLHFDVHVLFRALKESLEVSVDMREASGFGWNDLNSLMVIYPELSNHISKVA